jgi:DNA-binding transcriptional LysR family regulator
MDQLRAMRVFARVIDEGSFAGAARALDLAPAVVTRLIAELEEHLGARLIQRTTRSLALSSVGEHYLDRVRHILVDVDEAESQAQSVSESPQGHLRVMVPSSFAVHQLAKHLPAFHAEYPQVTLSLTSAIEFSGPDDRHDITVMALRDAPEGDFIARRLARSEVILCAAPAYLNGAGRPDTPHALEQHQLLLPPASMMQRDVTFMQEGGHAAVRVNPPRRPLLSTAHTDTLYASALAGLGIAGLMSLVVEDALRAGTLERVLPGWHAMSFGLWLTMPTRKHVPARTRVFWDFLLRTFGGEDRDPWQTHPRCSGAPSPG